MRSEYLYKRSNLFSGSQVSDGSVVGYSEEIKGQGTEAHVTLNNAGGATVVLEQRRVDNPSGWSEIGATIVISSVHRMLLQGNMYYRWRIKVAGTTPVTLSLRDAVPSSLEERPELIEKVPYFDGFPTQGEALNTFLAGLSPNELTLTWSLSRAQAGYWTDLNPFCIGSNGLLYKLNPDRGGGNPGNPEVDPVSGDGSNAASWISVASAGSSFSMQFKTSTTSPEVDTIPGDLPSASTAGVNSSEIQFYQDAIVGYVRDEDGWSEKGRTTLGTALQGKSAFQIWREQGNDGNESDFLESLAGKSAYQLWLDTGNSGTVTDYLESLAGEYYTLDTTDFDPYPECPTRDLARAAIVNAGGTVGARGQYTAPKQGHYYLFEVLPNDGCAIIDGPRTPLYRFDYEEDVTERVLLPSEVRQGFSWKERDKKTGNTIEYFSPSDGVAQEDEYPADPLGAASQYFDSFSEYANDTDAAADGLGIGDPYWNTSGALVRRIV